MVATVHLLDGGLLFFYYFYTNFSFGTSTRNGRAASMDPGPGHYQPLVNGGEPKYSMTPRRGDSLNIRSTTPGPGTYQPGYAGQSPPKFGFGSSTRAGLRRSETPGPGSYNYSDHDADLTASPKWGIGTGPRGDLARGSAVPGPGTYELQDGGVGPKYSMTARHDQKMGSSFPGPGTYSNFGNDVGTGSPKWSMRLRPDLNNRGSGAPGPGTYEPSVKQARTASPNWGFGTSTRAPLRGTDGGGPGAYDPSDPNFVSPKWGLGTSKRPPLASFSPNPGPGTYELRGATGDEVPKFSMTPRRDKYNPSASPGPGNYEPADPNIVSPKWGMGTAKRDGIADGNAVPGPGHYRNESTLAGPKYTMRGKSQQRSGAGNGNLGPTISQFGY